MGRKARRDYLYSGCYAHVISRSIRKLTLFKDKEDFETFIDIIRVVKKGSIFKVFHYCLMQTHFHWAVQIEDIEAFSRAMLAVKSRYSFVFHKKYRLSGPIWRERYKSLLIEDERYLRACGAYMENNPVRAGMVESADEWPYSSARHYSQGQHDNLIDHVCEIQEQNQVDVYLDEKEFFEGGHFIGSPRFRYQFDRNHKSG